MVVYSKQAGEVQPVQATTPTTQPINGNGQDDKKDEKKDEKPKISVPTQQEPDRMRVFRLPTDDELFAEKTPERTESILDKIRKSNQSTEMKYREKLEEFKKGLIKEKPTEPELLRVEDLVIRASDTLAPIPPTTKPGYSPTQLALEPSYVVHRRLFFEELNSERYGWDLGILQPFVSSAYFYKDVLLWPGHIMSNFKERFDTNAGKCLPGTPVAYYLYPPQLTIRGGLWETAAVVGTIMLLP